MTDKEVGELWEKHIADLMVISLIRKLVEITTLAGIEAIEPRFPISLWAHKQRLKRALRKYGIPEEGWK